MEKDNALELFKDEMENDDTQIKVNAVHRLPIVVVNMTTDKVISDLIPYLNKLIKNEEDEVLLAIAENLPKFKTFLDSNQMISILGALEFLLCVEETVVREQAVDSAREILKLFADEQIQKEVMIMMTNIFNQDNFQGKISVCYLIRMIYDKAGKEREKLRNIYYKLCEDETPLIKRSAAKEFGPLCLVMEKEVVNPDMINYFKKFMTDSDSVKVIALSSLIQLVKLFHNTDQQRLNVQVVVAASEDKSWRVRHELAKIFPQLIDGFGSQINELVPTLANLIKDCETEVRLAALEGIIQVIKCVNSEKVTVCIIPALLSLNNESSVHVKSCIGECLGSIAKSTGYNTFNSKLSGLLDSLLKDENGDVRLGVTRSLYDVFTASEGSLLSSIGTILGGLQKDSQYRIREHSIEIMAKLGISYGVDTFKTYIDALYFNYISDATASVRETGIKNLELLIAKYGANWTTVVLIPKLQNFLAQTKISYLQRMCILNSLTVCGKYLNSLQIYENIFPCLSKCLKDKVANVRFFTVRMFELIMNYSDENLKDKIKNAIKDLATDEDVDVKYFALKFKFNF